MLDHFGQIAECAALLAISIDEHVEIGHVHVPVVVVVAMFPIASSAQKTLQEQVEIIAEIDRAVSKVESPRYVNFTISAFPATLWPSNVVAPRSAASAYPKPCAPLAWPAELIMPLPFHAP